MPKTPGIHLVQVFNGGWHASIADIVEWLDKLEFTEATTGEEARKLIANEIARLAI